MLTLQAQNGMLMEITSKAKARKQASSFSTQTIILK